MCMDFWMGVGTILMTKPGRNGIPSWDAFSHSSGGITNDTVGESAGLLQHASGLSTSVTEYTVSPVDCCNTCCKLFPLWALSLQCGW